MISLLILTCNRKGMVIRSLRSLLRVLYQREDVEAIILDNASSDGTAEWLTTTALREKALQGRLRVLLSAFNLGVVGGRELLVEQARGETLVFLDSDVVALQDDWLERLTAPLADPTIGLCGPGGHWVLPGWKWFDGIEPGYSGEVDVISGYAQAFRKADLDGFTFDWSYYPYWIEDSDQCLWLREQGKRIVCTGDVGLSHLYQGSGDDGRGPEKMAYLARKYRGKGLIRAERE